MSSDALVLDLTFRDVKEESDLLQCMEEQIRAKEQNPTDSPTKKYKKDEVKAVKLGNNSISDSNIICNPIISIMNPARIIWLDLSFNSLSSVNVNLAEAFPNLTTLYLHANQITKLSELRKLSQFPNLRSVSFYGNPVEENKHYRNMALFCCPGLVQLDFSTVTASQRDKMQTWTAIYHKKLFPEEDP
mmetsp:Transcript_18046/g.18102  ORF Transcript_18046/g.18102 Transcript_18046/m.18102 type:complete len:188 (+) Transcript_18046:96-659(+)